MLIFLIFDPSKVQHDKQLEKFLRGEIRCQNFINQDLTFSQPKEDSVVPEKNTIAVPLITPQENNSPAEALYDRNRGNITVAPIQPVELVVGLTLEAQCKKEEDPDLTLIELFHLTPCKGHITTPL